MKLTDILNREVLAAEIAAGYVTRRQHPEFPELMILNYTDHCQFDNHWTETTRLTRGLIYNNVTDEVLARPFEKFFNYPEQGVQYDLDAPIMGAYDKWDGSLGIAYLTPGGSLRIATRGSFDSEQARHATALLKAENPLVRAQITQEILSGWTPLFEIVYPENRIVVNYGDLDWLVPLGSVDMESGYFRTDMPEIGARTLREVLALPPRDNAEGWVVWLDGRSAVKIKYEQYLALHRIVSSLTPKEIWRQLRAGTIQQFLIALPDEFHEWAKAETAKVSAAFSRIFTNAIHHYEALQQTRAESRKEQAIWVQQNVDAPLRGLVFGLLDGKNIDDAVWRMVEPKATEAIAA